MPFNQFRFKYSLYLLVCGIILSAINIYFNHDLFEMFVAFVHQYEAYDLDELLLLAIPLLVGLVIDLVNEKQRKQHLIDEERLKTLKATMNTVHDINNNFLNAMVYFVSEARDNKQLTDDSIEEVDKLIYKTAEQLKLLGNITHTNETDYGEGIKGIDYKSGQNKTSA